MLHRVPTSSSGTDCMQGELLPGLVRIGPGPSLLLPLASGELWAACCYAPLSAGQEGSNSSPSDSTSRWQLHKLRLGGAGGGLLPCALHPSCASSPPQCQQYQLLALASLRRQQGEGAEGAALACLRLGPAAGCQAGTSRLLHLPAAAALLPDGLQSATAAYVVPWQGAKAPCLVLGCSGGELHVLALPAGVWHLVEDGAGCSGGTEGGPSSNGDGGSWLAAQRSGAVLPGPVRQLWFIPGPKGGAGGPAGPSFSCPSAVQEAAPPLRCLPRCLRS